MKKGTLILIVLLAALTVAAGCGGGGEAEPPSTTSGDPEAGQQVFLNQGGCGSCHTIDGIEGANGQVGPDLSDIGSAAADRASEAGVDGAEAYVRESILEPNAFIAPECPTGPCPEPSSMPTNFEAQLSDEQIDDLIAFLMEQQ